MESRSTSSPRGPRRAIVSALVAGVLIAAFLAWRGHQGTGSRVYIHVEALDDGSVLVAEHDFDRDELELQLADASASLTSLVPLPPRAWSRSASLDHSARRAEAR